MKRVFLTVILFLFIFSRPVLSLENNKFGIHISHREDLVRAAELVNSQGGDWGYITIVIQDNDKNQKKWQAFFDLCREKHLIPLVRIATHPKGDFWEAPTPEDIASWADFFASLNWPVKARYLIIFNEPNQAKEWGGRIAPQEYALVLDAALRVFKERNSDFFILNAGFDQAAPDSKTTMDEVRFLKEVEKVVPGIFSRLDGWASHSYPRFGSNVKPWEKGRATLSGYLWELEILRKKFGVEKELPVFITETGWSNRGKNGQLWQYAFENIWLKDERVVAVTPFILNYPFPPFLDFSFLDKEGNPYPQYEVIKNLPKVKGQPLQIERFDLERIFVSSFLPTNFYFEGKVILKNNGQSIFGEKPLRIKSQSPDLKLTDLVLSEGKLVKPGEVFELDFSLETASVPGVFRVSWEGLPAYYLKVFDVGKLTESKETFFNRFFRILLLIRSRLWF